MQNKKRVSDISVVFSYNLKKTQTTYDKSSVKPGARGRVKGVENKQKVEPENSFHPVTSCTPA